MDVSWKFLYLFCRLNHFNLITVWPKIKSKRQQDKKWKRQKVRKTRHKGPTALAPVFQCCQRLYAEPSLKVVHSDTWLTVVTQFWQRCAGGSLGPVNFSPSKITKKVTFTPEKRTHPSLIRWDTVEIRQFGWHLDIRRATSTDPITFRYWLIGGKPLQRISISSLDQPKKYLFWRFLGEGTLPTPINQIHGSTQRKDPFQCNDDPIWNC